MKVAAIVVAAGASTRFGAKTKKPFFMLAGKPILVHGLEVLNRSPVINRIVLVVPASQREAVRKNIVQKYRATKVTDIVTGGKERTDSVWNGLQALEDSDFGPTSLKLRRIKFRILPRKIRSSDLVLINDGVRPFITEKMIRDTVRTAKKTGAAIIATKVTDTIKMANPNLVIDRTIPRDNLWCVQTPQVFKFSLLFDAYTRARKKKIKVTDDAGIMEQFGIPITLVPGPITNIKITTKEDLKIAEALLKTRSQMQDVRSQIKP